MGGRMDKIQKETLRYLGYGNQEADNTVMALVEECLEELQQAVRPGCMYREFPLNLFGEDGIDFSCFQTQSKHLTKNLKDCNQVLFFAATLGLLVDRLLEKYNRLQVSKAVVLQAATAAMLEEYCDRENEKLRLAYEAEGRYLRPRFSPGYGDFPLENQRELTGVLETGKRLGIKLTDSLLMIPSKSVTAVIGISDRKGICTVKGCEACEKTDCVYRRGTS